MWEFPIFVAFSTGGSQCDPRRSGNAIMQSIEKFGGCLFYSENIASSHSFAIDLEKETESFTQVNILCSILCAHDSGFG